MKQFQHMVLDDHIDGRLPHSIDVCPLMSTYIFRILKH